MKMIQHQTLTIAGAIGLLLFTATSHAEVDAHARNLAASCAACHGTNGHSVGGTPVLAGLDKALFVNQMKDFKSGARPATVMHHHAKGYTDEEFGKLADFFAAQKR
ncbi:MAG: cytochrome C [Gallionella sp.]|nr:cytochrome C [Gallionella sp.]